MSLAVEALEVVVGSTEARLVTAMLDSRLTSELRLEMLAPRLDAPDSPRAADDWVADLVADPGERWRSGWLRACAIRTAAGRRILARVDVGAARALGDPVVDEELPRVGASLPPSGPSL